MEKNFSTNSLSEQIATLLGIDTNNELALVEAVEKKLKLLKEEHRKARDWENRFLALAEATEASSEVVEEAINTFPSEGRERILRLLDPKSPNFMGSGMALADFIRHGHLLEYMQSWTNQTRKECKRRLHYVIKLSVALENIKQVSVFSTALGEAAIECVIRGKEDEVVVWIDAFSFSEEGQEVQDKYTPLWEPFTTLLRECVNTWPKPRTRNSRART